MKISHILIILLILAIIGFAIYWFWWRKRDTSKQPLPSVNEEHTNDEPKKEVHINESPSTDTFTTSPTTTDKPAPIKEKNEGIPQLKPFTGGHIKTKKWMNFKENKKESLKKFKQDFAVNIKNKLSTEDFNEIMSRPCEIDKSLFEPDTIRSFGRKIITPYDDLMIGLTTLENVDINDIDDIPDFEKRGFKNIDELNGDVKPDKVELINSELFGI